MGQELGDRAEGEGKVEMVKALECPASGASSHLLQGPLLQCGDPSTVLLCAAEVQISST